MKIFETIKQKRKAAKEQAIYGRAEEIIRIADFDNNLYIAFAGTPLIPIGKDYTSIQILEELYKLRSNYINTHLKRPNIAAML